MRSLIAVFAVAASVMTSAQAPALQRGDLVRVVPGAYRADVKATPLLLKVVAIPDDRMRVQDTALYVNDIAVTGFSEDFLARVAAAPERVPLVVPLGHYFVMGEQRSISDITEYWGQHAAGSIELAR
jgi:Signal peptidase, peptidase S26